MFKKIIRKIFDKDIEQLKIDYQATARRWVNTMLEQDEFQEKIDNYLQFQLEKYIAENNEMLYKKLEIIYDDYAKLKSDKENYNMDINKVWDALFEIRKQINKKK